MRHHYVRRHEQAQDLGSWSVGATNTAVLAQVMGVGPECDQERIILDCEAALNFARRLTDVAIYREPSFGPMEYRLGIARILRRGEHIEVAFSNGVNDTSVETKMMDYDALEFANALMTKSLELLTGSRLAVAGL